MLIELFTVTDSFIIHSVSLLTDSFIIHRVSLLTDSFRQYSKSVNWFIHRIGDLVLSLGVQKAIIVYIYLKTNIYRWTKFSFVTVFVKT